MARTRTARPPQPSADGLWSGDDALPVLDASADIVDVADDETDPAPDAPDAPPRKDGEVTRAADGPGDDTTDTDEVGEADANDAPSDGDKARRKFLASTILVMPCCPLCGGRDFKRLSRRDHGDGYDYHQPGRGYVGRMVGTIRAECQKEDCRAPVIIKEIAPFNPSPHHRRKKKARSSLLTPCAIAKIDIMVF